MRSAISALSSIYNAFIAGMAIIARGLIVAVFVMIIYDVSVRTIGLAAPTWTVSLAEYGLLFATVLGSPWLVRRKGHVYISVFTAKASTGLRRRIQGVALTISAAACLVLGYYATLLLFDLLERGVVDIRSFGTPAWVVIAPVPLCFVLMSCEFIRFLVGSDSMYEADRQTTSSAL